MSPGEAHGSGIAARLRAARLRRELSREALAVHSGLSWSAIAQIESGRRANVRPQTLAALAEALGVSIDYLVHGAAASSAMLEHRALLYETDEEFVDTVGPFLADGLKASEAVLAVTTKANIDALRDYLGSEAEEIEFIEAADWYSAPEPVLSAYQSFVSAKLETGAAWVRIVGEPVWSGRSDSEIGAWTRYESLFNLVFGASPMSIVCPYDIRAVPADVAEQALCTHPETVGPAGVASSSKYVDPAGFTLDRQDT
jgi:transcriptional regulator with XRE-family HTH domain